ncbi:MAG: hypothetical protein IPN36_15905 [Bacteroidetes bacterium]|nr:hypothetical protein [Bacteroidota bacterium]
MEIHFEDTIKGNFSWSIPLEIKNVDVDGSKLIVASDTVIHLISKSNGQLEFNLFRIVKHCL